jgi:hypothetical protein
MPSKKFIRARAKEELTAMMRVVSPMAVENLRSGILNGTIDGSYTLTDSGCGCFVGKLGEGDNVDYFDLLSIAGYQQREDESGETIWLNIEKAASNVALGETPETNKISALVLGWVDEFLEGTN